ncbi:lipoyltransferase [Myriangium duriaei CBS 260.36]|uniref:Octanoyltransferase n=1 Tax=Myriangium duriaei CBS 260.36 TaxID=1168546 RepID=A0A9P4IZ39_9PEZI|nr:lipoyltransferase [Myriangium duriaei CBS 260.36]
MLLRHLPLPGLTRYAVAGQLQDSFVASFLAHKASPTTAPAPSPTIITAQFHPVYTCGRREIGTTTPAQQAYLRSSGADFHESLRGGQTTFHGPGQLVAYPIVDLRRHGLTPRSYVCLLEKSIIRVCKRYGLSTMTTEDPGVWVTPESKIAALGVHLRRNVASHGIGLNVSTDLRWFERIVACGLEGKRTTSLEGEGVRGLEVDEVGKAFVEEITAGLEGVDGIERIEEFHTG